MCIVSISTDLKREFSEKRTALSGVRKYWLCSVKSSHVVIFSCSALMDD
uniref:Uncharacterized protein n=1 Tax=Arundo donax TaxID=35708 RepID=A0A0A9Q267_ARUDO